MKSKSARLDVEVEQLRKELPPGWRAWHQDGVLYAKRGDKTVQGETVEKVVARAVLSDSAWMRTTALRSTPPV